MRGKSKINHINRGWESQEKRMNTQILKKSEYRDVFKWINVLTLLDF